MRGQGGVGLCMAEYPERALDFDEIDRLAKKALVIIPVPLRQHLDGVLIIDRMTPLDRLSTRKSLKELRQAGGDIPPVDP